MPHLRLAREEDLPVIWDFVRRTIAHMLSLGNTQWGDDYPTYEHFVNDIAIGRLWAVVNEEDVPLGVSAFTTVDEPEYALVTWRRPSPAMALHRVAVDPNAQRMGVASALFAKAEELAREAGCESVRVDTYCLNDRMQALITKQGFERVGQFTFDNRPLPTICYDKVL